jgi:hypothetical protein
LCITGCHTSFHRCSVLHSFVHRTPALSWWGKCKSGIQVSTIS